MRDPDARRRRLRTAGPWALDGLLAVAVAGFGVATLATVLPFDPGSPRNWAAYLLVLAHTLPIAVRRRWPLAALAWGLATGAAFAALGLNLVSLSFAILIYVYSAAAHCPRRASLAGLAATEALLLLVWLARPRSIGDGGTVMVDSLIMAAAWWLGDGTRRRQEAVEEARRQAAELERAREELARRAVTEERLEIAPRAARRRRPQHEHHRRAVRGRGPRARQPARGGPQGAGRGRGDQPPGPGRDAPAAGVLRQEAEPRGSLTPAPGLAEVETLPPRWPGGGAGRGPDRGRPSCRPGSTCRPTGSSRRR